MSQESNNIPDTSQKWVQCNGQQLRKLAQAGLFWLEQNYQIVNELNVFPVPDGDTGINMLLTMRGAYGRIQNSEEQRVDKVALALSDGAIMSSRGNSGVILSQIWRGIARGLKGKTSFDVPTLAVAFKAAADTAYNGVTNPVEGTILTVVREGAEEAAEAAAKSTDLRFALDRILERCQQALERTPEMLPILKEAGVVDSGGQGLVFILEGMLRYVHGQLGTMGQQLATGEVPAHMPAQALAVPEGGEVENPYDVQFILLGQDLDVLRVRETIDAMGDSTVVVGDEKTIKVHVHVKDPGQPISYGVSLGLVTDVVVENMQMQMEEIVGGQGAGQQVASAEVAPAVNLNPDQIGVVAVVGGKGLADVFRSLGVAYVVNGGQTNNPSTEELLAAIEQVPTEKVIILPNNKNIILAAEAARDFSKKSVAVVPTRTIPQGISAMMSIDVNAPLQQMVAAMKTASDEVVTGQITKATRSVTIDDVAVAEGEIIGLVNGRLQASGNDIPEVVRQILARMEMDERELVSLYYGRDVSAAEAELVAQHIETLYPEVEVEVLSGGQAHYYYILGAE